MNQVNPTAPKQVTVKAHITLFLFMLYFFLVVPYVLHPLLDVIGLTSSTAGAVVISGFFNILPLLVYLLITRQRPSTILPASPLGVKNGLYVVGATLAVNFIVLFVNIGHFNTLFNDVAAVPTDMPGIGSLFIYLIAFGFLSATFEELWFRGPIYVEYQKRGVSIWKVALISGLLFGIVHTGIVQISSTTAIGVIWAVMLYYTRSIWAPILGHIAFNSLNILLNPGFYINDYAVYWDNVQTFALIYGIAILVTIPVSVLCMRKIILNNPREKEAAASETKLFTLGYWALIVLMIVIAVLLRI